MMSQKEKVGQLPILFLIKKLRVMIELKQLFGAYNVCARFTPGFLFVCALFFLKGEQNTLFQQNSVFFTMLVVMLSSIFGFISASSSKMLERFIWSKCENPTIKYFKKRSPKII